MSWPGKGLAINCTMALYIAGRLRLWQQMLRQADVQQSVAARDWTGKLYG